eukprot:1161741-Pelagomonas_calceolata.AAC.24
MKSGVWTLSTGEICIVLEGADGAPQSPIQGPPGVNAEQEGPAGGDAASTLVGTAPGVSPEQERARPMLMRLIASGGKERFRHAGFLAKSLPLLNGCNQSNWPLLEHGLPGDALRFAPKSWQRRRTLGRYAILSVFSGVPMSAAAKDVAKQLGMSRKELYNVAMQLLQESCCPCCSLAKPILEQAVPRATRYCPSLC